jgi:hypothetical protein
MKEAQIVELVSIKQKINQKNDGQSWKIYLTILY